MVLQDVDAGKIKAIGVFLEAAFGELGAMAYIYDDGGDLIPGSVYDNLYGAMANINKARGTLKGLVE